MDHAPLRKDPRAGGLPQGEDRFKLLVESVSDYAIFMLDTQGHVLTWNAGAERFKGYRAEEIIGSHFSRFYPPEALAAKLPEHELDMAQSAGSFEDEGWRVRKDGSLFWANVVITAMRGEDGELVGYAKVTRDLTQRRDKEQALRRSEEHFRLLVDGVAEYAIFMLDVNGRVVTWNSGAQRIKGYSAKEIVGRHFSVFYPPDAIASGWPEHELQLAAERGSFVDNGWRLRKDGSRLWANVAITALRDENGRLLGFTKLTRDMTENKRVEAIEAAGEARDEILEAERSARMAAQRATRVKDEFVATLSHELRMPLSAILGWTQILLRGHAPAEADQRRAIEVIDRNARAQVKLIDDLLDLNRIMAGKVRLDLQPISMREVAQSAIDSAAPIAAAKEISLRSFLEDGSEGAVANGDAARLQQVLWNLLTNAIKFTPKGGQVQVALRQVDSHVELSVADNGIGMPPDFIPLVFDRFSQRDSSTTRTHGGLGLGLAISKQLIELHGGSIQVSSPGEGRGSTFTIAISTSPAQEQGEGERAGPAEEELPIQSLPLPKLDGASIFVVDDESDVRELLVRILEEQGAKATPFSSAPEALAALARSRPSAIVSDVGMPGMDGYQMIRTLRAGDSRSARVPALALTAFARPDDHKRALTAGYQSHLAKPFDIAALVLAVAELIGR